MKVMFDTNIFLDVLLEREPFVTDSAEVLKLCEERKLNGFISASAITDIFYLVHKYCHSNEITYNAIGKVLEIVRVCNVTNNDVLMAYQEKAKDFEDCLLATCAKNNNCDCIVTRNKKDFDSFGISLYTPSELIAKLNC